MMIALSLKNYQLISVFSWTPSLVCNESELPLVCSNSVPEVGMLFTFGLCGAVQTLCGQSELQCWTVNVQDIYIVSPNSSVGRSMCKTYIYIYAVK